MASVEARQKLSTHNYKYGWREDPFFEAPKSFLSEQNKRKKKVAHKDLEKPQQNENEQTTSKQYVVSKALKKPQQNDKTEIMPIQSTKEVVNKDVEKPQQNEKEQITSKQFVVSKALKKPQQKYKKEIMPIQSIKEVVHKDLEKPQQNENEQITSKQFVVSKALKKPQQKYKKEIMPIQSIKVVHKDLEKPQQNENEQITSKQFVVSEALKQPQQNDKKEIMPTQTTKEVASKDLEKPQQNENEQITSKQFIVLGLNDKIVIRFNNLTPFMKNHHGKMTCLLRILKDFEKKFRNDEALTRKDKLQKRGFTEDKAVEIDQWITNIPVPGHKSLQVWVEIYVENVFKYDPEFNKKLPLFSYPLSPMNEWFTVSPSRSEKRGRRSYTVNVFNTENEEDAKKALQDKIDKIKPSDSNALIYYHGTDHEAAKSIIDGGIILGASKVECDFSNGVGFYLAKDCDFAIKQFAMRFSRPAVIMFILTDPESWKCLDLSTENRPNDWTSITDYYRKRKKNISEDLLNEANACDYIKGPMWQGEGNPRLEKEQICIRTEKMANAFSSSIIAGIFWINNDQ
ncbi:uncharacterized protein LOC124436778 isoform X3 [Xenia sp. Carnegie-2017]|uniref:uncharacterized protein LOC124436778 isoform X3 n=1 Tax=Xenia sp. Carnegie-2017 TaxID=2897299 RepID=UPI001F0461C5|nr:uncharacterized protein LOC124436778 isoform X3 [Xenia sp. Carnegie-2017]